jgi:prefoldin subunit 5
MLLVITPSGKARACAETIQEVTSEETHVAATLSQAMAQLRAREYVAVLIDQAFMETEPVESDMVLEHIGTAIPVQVNFAISGIDRVVRELRTALQRHKKEILQVRQQVQQILRNELKSTATAILLSCEMALKVPHLPDAAEVKMQAVRELAQQLCASLDGNLVA